MMDEKLIETLGLLARQCGPFLSVVTSRNSKFWSRGEANAFLEVR